MRQRHIAIILLFMSCGVAAQDTFTEYLTRNKAGEGKVVLCQDAELTALVNGKGRGRDNADVEANVNPETTSSSSSTSTSIIRVNGFRVQVYAGTNNRKSKNEAYAMAARVRTTFPGVPVYTHFTSPRWICRVGNFRTYEEAFDLLRQMREAEGFSEAAIVRCKVSVAY